MTIHKEGLPQCSVAGLDIGGTKTACVEGTLNGGIIQRIEMPMSINVSKRSILPS